MTAETRRDDLTHRRGDCDDPTCPWEAPMTAETRITHTPGPWKTDERGCVWAGHVCIANASANAIPNFEANARLIAAAPDLLSMLSRLVSSVVDDHECYYCGPVDYTPDGRWLHDEEDCPIPEAEAIVRKATGEE